MKHWQIAVSQIWMMPTGRAARVIMINGEYVTLLYENSHARDEVTVSRRFIRAHAKYLGDASASIRKDKPRKA